MKSKNKYARDFWNPRCLFLLFVLLVALVLLKDTTPPYAQRPPTRAHTVTQKNPIELVPATVKLREAPHVSVKTVGGKRVVTSNGIPNHLVGQFPNCGNPHTIERQHHSFTITSTPILATSPIWLESGWVFGIAVNGIPWEPLAAEWYHGQRDSKWRYEALSGAIDLGADGNYAHVQPGGKYHYHGLPTGLLGAMNVSKYEHSPIVGWAADGFPIYSKYGHLNGKNADDGIKEYKSGYRVRDGYRPGGYAPGGIFDGAFIADYEYVPGSGDLDQCNGANVATPDFPNGTYAYFLTTDWPVVPRCFTGSPDNSFNKRGRPPASKTTRGHRPSNCGPSAGMTHTGDRRNTERRRRHRHKVNPRQ